MFRLCRLSLLGFKFTLEKDLLLVAYCFFNLTYSVVFFMTLAELLAQENLFCEKIALVTGKVNCYRVVS